MANILTTIRQISAEYRKWRDDWDDLCARCGRCCYRSSLNACGEAVTDFSSPCEFLDEETRLCRVFENRFRECANCGKVNLFCVLFNPYLPASCAYVKTFRVWKPSAARDRQGVDR